MEAKPMMHVRVCTETRYIYVTFEDGNNARVSFDPGAEYESKEWLNEAQDEFMKSVKEIYDTNLEKEEKE